MFLPILALSLSAVSATLCSPAVYPYASQNVSVPFTAVTIAQSSSTKAQVQPPKISGTLSIINGCSFVVKAFTFTPNAGSTYTFYGITKTNASMGVQMIPGSIATSSGTDVTFNFIADAALLPPYSWEDISGIEIFDTANQIIWATAILPSAANGTLSNATMTLSKPTVQTGVPPIDPATARSSSFKLFASGIMIMGSVLFLN